MHNISIRYSHDKQYPWRILIQDEGVIYHAKDLIMDGYFVGSFGSRPEGLGADIQCSGTYEISDPVEQVDSKEFDKTIGIHHILNILKINVYGYVL